MVVIVLVCSLLASALLPSCLGPVVAVVTLASAIGVVLLLVVVAHFVLFVS